MNESLNYPKKTERWKNGESAITWGKIIHFDKIQNRLLFGIMQRLSGRCQRVLDLGSGNGRIGMMLPDSIEYFGIDFSVLVDDCSNRFRGQSQSRTFLKCDLTDGIPPSVGNNFDLIFALFVLHFFTPAGIEKLLTEAKNLLGPNGAIVFIGYGEESRIERLSRKVLEGVGLEVYDIGELDSSRYVGHIGRMK